MIYVLLNLYYMICILLICIPNKITHIYIYINLYLHFCVYIISIKQTRSEFLKMQ